MATVRSINAITLATASMADSVRFYTAAGYEVTYGGPDADFTTCASNGCYVNLITPDPAAEPWQGFWGRVIFHVDDVDAMYRQLLDAGYTPRHAPRDAPWGERMFAINDPSGHDLSFARPL